MERRQTTRYKSSSAFGHSTIAIRADFFASPPNRSIARAARAIVSYSPEDNRTVSAANRKARRRSFRSRARRIPVLTRDAFRGATAPAQLTARRAALGLPWATMTSYKIPIGPNKEGSSTQASRAMSNARAAALSRRATRAAAKRVKTGSIMRVDPDQMNAVPILNARRLSLSVIEVGAENAKLAPPLPTGQH